MATACQARQVRRIIPTWQRLNERSTYGDMASVHGAAVQELAAGRLANAWGLYHEILGHSLRLKWLAMPGHEASTITGREALLYKLRCSGSADRWTFDLLSAALRPAKRVSKQSAELLAGIVATFSFDAEPKVALFDYLALPVEGGGV